MTDDIVTRLRGKYQGQLPICIEAADEIERLRAELAMAQKWRDNFKLAFEKERKNTEYWYGIALPEEQKNG